MWQLEVVGGHLDHHSEVDVLTEQGGSELVVALRQRNGSVSCSKYLLEVNCNFNCIHIYFQKIIKMYVVQMCVIVNKYVHAFVQLMI